LPEQKGETRAKVAEAIGMKPRTYAKVKHVYDTANNERGQLLLRAIAQQQLAALDAGETTARTGYVNSRPRFRCR